MSKELETLLGNAETYDREAFIEQLLTLLQKDGITASEEDDLFTFRDKTTVEVEPNGTVEAKFPDGKVRLTNVFTGYQASKAQDGTPEQLEEQTASANVRTPSAEADDPELEELAKIHAETFEEFQAVFGQGVHNALEASRDTVTKLAGELQEGQVNIEYVVEQARLELPVSLLEEIDRKLFAEMEKSPEHYEALRNTPLRVMAGMLVDAEIEDLGLFSADFNPRAEKGFMEEVAQTNAAMRQQDQGSKGL